MILVLVGTNPYDFSRLVKKIDEIAERIGIPFVVQTGNTRYRPRHCESFAFKAREEVQALMQAADLVVTQGGYGSMTDALLMGKRLIAVPRLRELNEAQDNQVELVEYFESRGYLKACYDIEKLEGLIAEMLKGDDKTVPYVPETKTKVSDIIQEFLDEL